MFKAFVFDFEGTIVDFQWRLKEGERELREKLRELGFDLTVFSQDNYAQMWNRALGMASGERAEEIKRELIPIYDRYDEDALERWSLKDGVKELLSLLRERGKRIGLVTNVGRRAVEGALGRFGVRDLFDEVVTRNDTTFMKPRGEGIRRCLSALGVGREEAIFIGDSLSDLYAARDAGVKVAIVKGGESSPQEIMKSPPDYLWDSLDEVLKILKDQSTSCG